MYLVKDKNTLSAKAADVKYDSSQGGAHIIPDVLYPAWSGLLTENTGHTFTDSSASAHAITSTTNAHHSGAIKKIGSTSLSLNKGLANTGSDHLYFGANNTDFQFGTGDFTIEFWFNVREFNPTGASFQTWVGPSSVSWGTSNGFHCLTIGATPKAKFSIVLNSSAVVLTGTTTIVKDTWYHYAAVRIGTSLKLYLNGAQEATATVSGTHGHGNDNAGRPITIGSRQNHATNLTFDQFSDVNVDEVRIVKGLGVYTGAFTAPTTALTTTWSVGTNIAANSTASNVKFLLHSDNGGNVGAYGTEQADGRKYYYTDIKGSKPIKDPRIGSHFGSQRHTLDSLQLLEQETATHGSNVYSVDGREWCRGAGNVGVDNDSNDNRLRLKDTATTTFLEVTGFFSDASFLHYSHANKSIRYTLDGATENSTDFGATSSAGSPLGGRYVSVGSLVNLGLGASLGIHTIKFRRTGSSNHLEFYGIELIAQDTTSTATKSKIQIPSQNVVSYGKKFTVSGTPHYNPFATKGDDSASTIPNNTTGDSVGTGWAGATSAYWDSSLDTATSLGLGAWESGGNYYRPVNGGRVVKWVDSTGIIKTSVNMMPPEAHAIEGYGGTGAGTCLATGTHNWSTQYLPQFGNKIVGSAVGADDCSSDNTGNWENTGAAAISFDTDHYEITNTSDSTTSRLTSLSVTAGKFYKISAQFKNGTASSIGIAGYFYDGVTAQVGQVVATDGSFTYLTWVFKSTNTSSAGKLGVNVNPTGASPSVNIEMKNFTIYEVEDPSIQAEVAKTFDIHEFGNGAANGGTGAALADTTMLTATDDAVAYVMDDGLTSFSSALCDKGDSVGISILNGNHYFTFVGTGFSYDTGRTVTHGGTDDYQYFIDGVSILDQDGTGSYTAGNNHMCQNLPYGTHIFRIEANGAADTDAHQVKDVTFYQPKMPPIPEDAVVIADYMLMADFVPQTAAGTEKISKGVRKVNCSRDIFYDETDGDAFGFVVDTSLSEGFNIFLTGGADSGTSMKMRIPSFGTNYLPRGFQSDSRVAMYIGDSAQADGVTTRDNSASQGAYQHLTTSLAPGVYNFGGNAVAGTNGSTTSFDIATPIHTSSHYQAFETPFLHELVGGDRNMEQTNLVVTPDGKTWDEVTRNTSYIGNIVHKPGSNGSYGEDVLVIMDDRRGTMETVYDPCIQKDFACAYDRDICLRDGEYVIHTTSVGYNGATVGGVGRIYINGLHRKQGTTGAGGYAMSSIISVVQLKRGDYVQVKGQWHANHVLNAYWIDRI